MLKNIFKKTITTYGLVVVLSVSLSGTVEADSTIDTSKLNSGVISINHKSNNGSAVRISKGDQKQDYILKSNNSFPLQFGDGEYTIQILERVEENKYKQVKKQIVNLNLKNENDIYLQSTQMVNWNSDMNAIKVAKELTKDAKTDREKVSLIYEYITNNIKYDYKKAESIQSGYIPNIDQTLTTKDGICYDYSALLASMLRSVNVPTKLVMGRNTEITIYHAWNEVYLQDTNSWVVIDTAYDASIKKAEIQTPMIKDPKNYTIEKQY